MNESMSRLYFFDGGKCTKNKNNIIQKDFIAEK
jgi:hypothetical protein